MFRRLSRLLARVCIKLLTRGADVRHSTNACPSETKMIVQNRMAAVVKQRSNDRSWHECEVGTCPLYTAYGASADVMRTSRDRRDLTDGVDEVG